MNTLAPMDQMESRHISQTSGTSFEITILTDHRIRMMVRVPADSESCSYPTLVPILVGFISPFPGVHALYRYKARQIRRERIESHYRKLDGAEASACNHLLTRKIYDVFIMVVGV